MGKNTKKKNTEKKDTRMDLPVYTQTLLDMLTICNTRVPLNSPLSDQDNKNILNMCIDLYDATANYRQTYDDCHKLINTTLSKYNYQPRIPGKSSDPQAMQNLPYEIKILIYTMAYKAFELYDKASPAIKKTVIKPSQKGILEYIGTPLTASNYQCYKLSPKTFTQFGLSPKVFYDINNYKQINLPSTYAGAKVRYLGYALNHLVAYAGTIDNYVDLFGGSASAYMAVTKTNNVDYYINEYDFFVINYYNVIMNDTLYKAYISKLCTDRNKLQAHIPAGTAVIEGKNLFKSYQNVENKWRSKYPTGNYDQVNNGILQKNSNWQLYETEDKDEKVNAAVAYTYIHSFTVTGGSHTAGAINNSSIRKFCDFDAKEYDKLHAHMKRLKGIYNSDMLSNNEFLIEYFTDKASGKYQAIKTMAKSMRNEDIPDVSEEEEELLRLFEKDSNGKPRSFCTLFYSDSPYLATRDYQAGSINVQQMKDLIERLAIASQNKSHFIFSCRASKTIEDTTYQALQIEEYKASIDLHNPNRLNGDVVLDTNVIYENTEELIPCSTHDYGRLLKVNAKKTLEKISELLSQNNDIYQYIFKEFENNSKDYYVLACMETNRFKVTSANIETMLKVMLPIEVFITDYDFICPLDYTDAQGKTYRFNKYTISQFCNLLDDNMFKSSKKYDIVRNSNDSQSGYSFQ